MTLMVVFGASYSASTSPSVVTLSPFRM